MLQCLKKVELTEENFELLQLFIAYYEVFQDALALSRINHGFGHWFVGHRTGFSPRYPDFVLPSKLQRQARIYVSDT